VTTTTLAGATHSIIGGADARPSTTAFACALTLGVLNFLSL
jgi:hypothetical protein